MNAISNRVEALIKLGIHLKGFDPNDPNYSDLQSHLVRAKKLNSWFTHKNIETTFESWGTALNEANIKKWLLAYELKKPNQPKNIALILAGNIPMVGFHDLLSVWVCGHKGLIKCASKDEVLLPFMTNFLEHHANEQAFSYEDQPLKGFDAVIATGSNNAARYFEHYFGNYPHIIRKNRNGIAVLNGLESKSDLEALGDDVLQYFGLGCRNVSKVYIPENYDLNALFGGVYPYAKIIEHPKYANNYDYNKAVFLMSEHEFLENGFFMLKQDPAFSVPIACLHYEYYKDEQGLKSHLNANKDAIQCIVSQMKLPGAIDFGTAQKPALWDYADGVDTIAFLNQLV
jgi:hypothetical protein